MSYRITANEETVIQENLLTFSKNSESLWHFNYSIPHPLQVSIMEIPLQAGISRIQGSFLLKGYDSPQQGQAACVSHLPQLRVAEAKFLTNQSCEAGVPFLHPAPTQRADDLGQVARTTGALMALTPVCS